ncbi:hypothetical protein BDZ91DRAFT_767761 [Kalaharituber pfeilii]|nr:hypothetical protein BDZ91DRAFT_767761 [Kalaharituber pfeilii]
MERRLGTKTRRTGNRVKQVRKYSWNWTPTKNQHYHNQNHPPTHMAFLLPVLVPALGEYHGHQFGTATVLDGSMGQLNLSWQNLFTIQAKAKARIGNFILRLVPDEKRGHVLIRDNLSQGLGLRLFETWTWGLDLLDPGLEFWGSDPRNMGQVILCDRGWGPKQAEWGVTSQIECKIMNACAFLFAVGLVPWMIKKFFGSMPSAFAANESRVLSLVWTAVGG